MVLRRIYYKKLERIKVIKMKKFNVRTYENKMSKDNYLELVGQLIDIFEDFLDDKGIIIENHERDEDVNLISEESANIYGADYYTLENKITDTLQKWDIIGPKDNEKKLNTMDSFRKGFRIVRNGQIITLTPEEMSDFRFLDKAIDGRNCLDCYNQISDEDEQLLIKEMMNDEETCYNIENDFLNIVFDNTGVIEQEVIEKYVKRNKELK